jgi:DNA-binding transcriptional MocR family regulator
MTRVLDFGGNRMEKVREGLLHDLLDGSLRVGTKLPNEQGLATRFGVSRSSVREAVSALSSDATAAAPTSSACPARATPSTPPSATPT